MNENTILIQQCIDRLGLLSADMIRGQTRILDEYQSIHKRLGKIEDQLKNGASPADLALIAKELAENKAKLVSAQNPT